MPEFETGPDQLRDWLREHDMVRTPHEWTQLERDLDRAIEEGRRRAQQQQPQQQPPHRHGPGDGNYQWDDFATRHNQPGLTEPEREAVDEEQSAAWTRMLNAWEQFRQQVADLHSIADGDSEEIVRQIGHTITAVNMIENNDWAEPFTAEFSAWEMLSTDGIDAEHMHAAAHAIVEAGQTLYNQWHAAIEAGNYSSYSLYDEQHEFVRHCTQARERLHQH